ncbi:hypothetical protein Tco_1474963 [Tanacetum coccineum]
MWLGLTLSGLVKRKSILGLYHCAPSATIITMGCVLLSAQTAKELGIWPEIVEVLLMLTTKELLGKYRRLLHVLNVEFKGTTRRICPKLKNKNYRNRSGNSKAHRRACALGGNNANPDLNVVTGMTKSGRKGLNVQEIWLNTTNIRQKKDLEYGPLKSEGKTLIIHDDESNHGRESRLNIISCTKTGKYLLKGCHVFLAHITEKKTEDKSEEKRLEDVPIVRDFLEVFPEEFPGVPPTRQVEFQIDFVPSVAPVARAPYRLSPSKMK